MPAQPEEVVVDPDMVQAQDLGERLTEDLFPRGERAAAARPGGRAVAGCGKRGAVQLAVHRDRQGVQDHEVRGDHGRGQPGTSVRVQVVGELSGIEPPRRVAGRRRQPGGLRAGGVDGVHSGAGQFVRRLHGGVEALVVQQPDDGVEAAVDVVDLDHDPPDDRPVLGLDAQQDVQLALFHVDLQEVDHRDVVVPDHLREGPQRDLDLLAAQPLGHQFRQRVLVESGSCAVTADDLFQHVALFAFVGEATGQQRQIGVVGERRRSLFAADAAVGDHGVHVVQLGVEPEHPGQLGDRLERVDPAVRPPRGDEQGEQADMAPDVHHVGLVGQGLHGP
ncbi:hypothetical protein Airi02_030080 [Actinoallomurus iriomotensis]|uniref:Uncharacterized protein n=1 Tax=Actinoallomurus iriomotensis TaxID=478107 RepID=A0A9W6S0W6_9ACTN|nr:hypothetical protein Airi02_030080 [Actinoallomurus iriomotensis]